MPDGVRLRGWIGLFGLITVAWLAAAAPAGAVTPSTHFVPVTQPDELGAPVRLDTDVYLPEGEAPASGWPLLVFSHGGGNQKREHFVVYHAEEFVRNGYAVIAYSQRGHGNSDGQASVAGPKEVRDMFDVLAWALGLGGRDSPPHSDFRIDASRIAAGGESQGGLNTNVPFIHSTEPQYNPYGIRFRALIPGNTPDRVYEALVPNNVVKLSFGLGLVQTYLVGAGGQVSPTVHKWIAVAALDQPGLAGGEICDATGHDTPTSTMKSDLAFRSVGCYPERMTVPTLWAQSFDDWLFPAEMAINVWRQMPGNGRLYLNMGGHAAPFTPAGAEQDELDAQVRFLNSVLKPGGASALAAQRKHKGKRKLKRGKRLLRRAARLRRRGKRAKAKKLRKRGKALVRAGRKLISQAEQEAATSGQTDGGPRIVYWRRDPRVAVPGNLYRWPENAWTRLTANTWPPAGTGEETLQLGANGSAVASGAQAGALVLAPLSIDFASDPVGAAALSATPLGTSPIPSQLPATNLPGMIAGFQTQPFGAARELSGPVEVSVPWTPLTPDSQVIIKLFDRAPDGTLTLLTRGATGIRGATPGMQRQVTVRGNETSALVPAGHSLLLWISAGELSFYKPYVGSLGGLLGAGTDSTLTLPLRSP